MLHELGIWNEIWILQLLERPSSKPDAFNVRFLKAGDLAQIVTGIQLKHLAQVPALIALFLEVNDALDSPLVQCWELSE